MQKRVQREERKGRGGGGGGGGAGEVERERGLVKEKVVEDLAVACRQLSQLSITPTSLTSTLGSRGTAMAAHSTRHTSSSSLSPSLSSSSIVADDDSGGVSPLSTSLNASALQDIAEVCVCVCACVCRMHTLL